MARYPLKKFPLLKLKSLESGRGTEALKDQPQRASIPANLEMIRSILKAQKNSSKSQKPGDAAGLYSRFWVSEDAVITGTGQGAGHQNQGQAKLDSTG